MSHCVGINASVIVEDIALFVVIASTDNIYPIMAGDYVEIVDDLAFPGTCYRVFLATLSSFCYFKHKEMILSSFLTLSLLIVQ